MTDGHAGWRGLCRYGMVALLAICIGCGEGTKPVVSNQTKSSLPLVTVDLGGPSSAIAADPSEAPASGDQRRTVFAATRRVRVLSSGDDIVNVDSKFTMISHPNGVVQEVMITFPLTAVEYKQAIASMRIVLNGVPDVDSASIDGLLDRWQREPTPKSVFDDKSGRIVSKQGLRLFCKIKFSEKTNRCFCSIHISR